MLKFIKNISYPVWLISFTHGCIDMNTGAFYVALPFLKNIFDLTYAQVAALVLVQQVTSSVVQPLFGYLSDRKQMLWFMPLGAFIMGFSLPIIFHAPSYHFLFIIIAINGLGSAIFHPQGAKTVNLISGNEKGKALSVFSLGGSLGVAAGSIFFAYLLVGGTGLRLFIFTIPYIFISLALIKIIPKIKISQEQSIKTINTTHQSNLMLNISFLAFMGMVLVRSTVQAGVNTFVPLYYVSYLSGSAIYASFLLSIFQASGSVGTLLGGIMSDRYGSKRVMLFTMLPITIALFLFQYSSGFLVFFAVACAGVLLSATSTSALVLIQRLLPNSLGLASGLNLGFSAGLGAVGVLGIGQVADVLGLPYVFIILALLPILGFIFTIFIKDPKEEPYLKKSSTAS